MQLTVYWVVEKKKGYGKMRKKLFRRVVSITMAGLMAFTASFSDFSGTLMAKADTNAQPGDLSAATDYGLVDNVQDGVILHCWNWSYSNISANMEAIAEAGYSAVQTSLFRQPRKVQQEKAWVPTGGYTTSRQDFGLITAETVHLEIKQNSRQCVIKQNSTE